MEQLDWLDTIGDQPRLEKEQIKNFDTEYDREYNNSSIDTETMKSFFATKVKQLLDKYRKGSK